jgi:hypothetical protein
MVCAYTVPRLLPLQYVAPRLSLLLCLVRMKVFMGQKDLNKDFEQAAMCNSRDLTRTHEISSTSVVCFCQTQENSRELMRSHESTRRLQTS